MPHDISLKFSLRTRELAFPTGQVEHRDIEGGIRQGMPLFRTGSKSTIIAGETRKYSGPGLMRQALVRKHVVKIDAFGNYGT